MNRIILIGNGFDLAHGLPTSYGNFIDWYWEQWKIHLENNNQTYTESPLLKFYNRSGEDISYFIDRKIGHLTGRDIGFALMENDYSFSVEACPLLEEICTSIETKGWADITIRTIIVWKRVFSFLPTPGGDRSSTPWEAN